MGADQLDTRCLKQRELVANRLAPTPMTMGFVIRLPQFNAIR